MKLMEVIEKRQSIRKYKDQEITNEDINKILDAGRLAPSGKNIQNWYFAAVKNKNVIDEIVRIIAAKNKSIVEKLAAEDEKKAQRFEKFCKNFTLFVKDAPVLILVFAKNYYPSGYAEMKLCGEDEKILDELLHKSSPGMQCIGAAIENMTLMATDLGYGSCWLTSANYAAQEIEEYMKAKIDLEDPDYFFACMMSVGIPADAVHNSPGRKNLSEVSTIIE